MEQERTVGARKVRVRGLTSTASCGYRPPGMVESIKHARGKAPTIADVAALAGVSGAAASMALRDHQRISEPTRRRVKAAAAQLGYVRNAAAQALREKRAGAVAVVVPNSGRHVFGHVYFMHLLQGVNGVANRRDSILMISTNAEREDGFVAYERILQSQRTDGVIVASAAINDPYVARMRESGFPLVLVGEVPEPLDVATVSLPDRAAARAVCQHLSQHGHARVAHISGPVDHQTGRDRLLGFTDVFGTDDQSNIRHGDYSEESGAKAMASLLSSGERYTAVFCANDEMAYGAMSVARESGLTLPDDLAVIGYDDFGLARVLEPALTTVRVPAEELGRVAAELLFEVIDGRPPRRAVVDVDLVLRRSCGCHDTQVLRL